MSKSYTKDSRHALVKEPPAIGFDALDKHTSQQGRILRDLFRDIDNFVDLDRYEDMTIYERHDYGDFIHIHEADGKLIPTHDLIRLTTTVHEYESSINAAKEYLFAALQSKLDDYTADEPINFTPSLVCDVYNSIILYLRRNHFNKSPWHRDGQNEDFYLDRLTESLVEEVGLSSSVISVVVEDLFKVGLLYIDTHNYPWNQKLTFNAPLFDLWIGELTPAFFEQRSWLVQRFNELELKKLISTKYNTSNAGFVYLAVASTGHYKIGYSKNPKIRVKQLSSKGTLLPIKIELLHSFLAEDALQAEKDLHEHFASKRFQGEWFSLEDEDVELITSLNGFTLTEGFRYRGKDKSLVDEWQELMFNVEVARGYFVGLDKQTYKEVYKTLQNEFSL